MSPKKLPVTISSGPSGGLELVVDGQQFTANFDDLGLLRDLLEVNEKIQAITGKYDGKSDPKPVLSDLLDISEDARLVIDAALGSGAHAALFGPDRQPIIRSLVLVAELAKLAGREYDRLLEDYQPKP